MSSMRTPDAHELLDRVAVQKLRHARVLEGGAEQAVHEVYARLARHDVPRHERLRHGPVRPHVVHLQPQQVAERVRHEQRRHAGERRVLGAAVH